MITITAKELRLNTKAVLDRLEQGETLVITRNGRTIGRIEPLKAAKFGDWAEIMGDVWRAQKSIRLADRVPNRVLVERQRRRR